MKTVIFYTREGCCLCDEARQVVRHVLDQHPGAFSLQERDIDRDEELHRMYLERIPVITIDGQEAFELFVEQSELEHRLGIVERG